MFRGKGQCVAAELAAHADRLQRSRFPTVVWEWHKVRRPRGQLKPPTVGVAEFWAMQAGSISSSKWRVVVIGQPSPMGEMPASSKRRE